jgi:phosphate-selective porin OprO/OprP
MLATAAIFATGSAGAQTAGDSRQIDRLEGQIQALQREVGDLKKKALTAEKNTYAAAPPPGDAAKAPVAAPTAIATMSPNYRPSICTPDQMNCISLTGVLQVDLGGYNYRPATGRGIAATGVPIAPSTVPQQLDVSMCGAGASGCRANSWATGIIRSSTISAIRPMDLAAWRRARCRAAASRAWRTPT